jgi:hypothetical protein
MFSLGMDWVDSDVLLTSRGLSMGVAMARPMKRSMSLRACMLTLLSRDSGGLGNRNGDMKVSSQSFQSTATSSGLKQAQRTESQSIKSWVSSLFNGTIDSSSAERTVVSKLLIMQCPLTNTSLA